MNPKLEKTLEISKIVLVPSSFLRSVAENRYHSPARKAVDYTLATGLELVRLGVYTAAVAFLADKAFRKMKVY